MGKKQHQKDKLYLTTTEWSTLYGGKKTSTNDRAFKRLPFHCCSLTMQPFEHPYCTKEGVIFDLLSIVPFLKKYGLNPVTGEKQTAKDLIKLNFHKNSEGKYHCPVTFSIFNENSHIVAVSTTGNVFSFDAVERLNIKLKHWKDLINDEAFTRKDLITIQDPTQLEKFNYTRFYHIRKKLKLLDEDEEIEKKNPRYNIKSINAETKESLDELQKDYKAPDWNSKVESRKADNVNAANCSMGRVAASFTSTTLEPLTKHETAILDENYLRYQRMIKKKRKGYVRLNTNFGPLNLELHCDMVPKTCDNFIKHCLSGYYNGTKFHRSLRNFILQGGDPEGTGKGGQSVWGEPFEDEFKPNLTHTGRGVLSMANAGPNTNKSQFFFTYRSARHLDNKHSVFGQIVGGLDTLTKIEYIKCNKKDEPEEPVLLESAQVFVNPFEDVDAEILHERGADDERKAEEGALKRKKENAERMLAPKVYGKGAGKFIDMSATQKYDKEPNIDETEHKNKRKKSKNTASELNDFSSW